MIWAKIASILMLTGVLLGAFGSHALKEKLPIERIDIFKTGVLYHFIHALGLFVIAWLMVHFNNPNINLAGIFILIGIILFSGSLYVYAITAIRWLGFVTPLGGVCFLIGWTILFLNIKS